MTREEWEYLCASVKDHMVAHLQQFLTPISMSEEAGSGVAWGSGGYLEANEGTWLITASHVFSDAPSGARLAHLPVPGDDYVAITDPPELAKWPVDAAAERIAPIPASSNTKAVPKDLLSDCYSAVDGELLFWVGFPGYKLERHDPILPDRRRSTLFGELPTLGLPMLSQALQGEDPQHAAFDRDQHVAIHYPSAAKRAPEEPATALPHPKGMSGSLLWNTRFVEATSAGLEWSPASANVCGVIWAALDSPEVVLATKIEFVRKGLTRVFA